MRKVVRESRPPPDVIREAVLAYARKRGPNQPILIGEVSLHLGWWASLNIAEAVLNEMVTAGLLAHMSKSDCARRGIEHAYVLAV